MSNAAPAEKKTAGDQKVNTSTRAMVGVDDAAAKLTHSGWLRMEQNHTPFTKSVLISLMNYGQGEDAKVYYTQDRSLQSVGQKLYIEQMRPEIDAILKLTPVPAGAAAEEKTDKKKAKANKKGGKGAMSKEEIIHNKLSGDITKFLPDVIKAANSVPRAREHLAELRLMQMMLYANHVLVLLNNDPNSHVGYEGLIAMHNAIASAKNAKGIAAQILVDAQEMKDRLEKHVRFSYEELMTVYPRLVFSNIYSELYHEAVIKPYKDQQRLIDSLEKTSQASRCSLTFYNTVPGSGKTTAVVGVVSKVMREPAPKVILTEEQEALIAAENVAKKELNMGRRNKERKRNIAKKSQKGAGCRVVIFVCTNMLVREQVGRDAYNIDIPFAVAASMTYREHFNARARDVSLVISDLESAVAMLEKFANPVLFIDEPTIAAETDHSINDKIMHLLTNCPRQTILSSATLPEPEEVPKMIAAVRKRHPDIELLSITSNRIGIGCHAIHQGITVFPFEGCTDVASLTRALDTLAKNPFMFRLLSIEVVVTLRSRMGDIKEDYPSWAVVFPDPSSISHQLIAEHAIDLLTRLLATKDDFKIKQVCMPLDRAKYRPFSLESLLTEDAHQHMQGALYATGDPLKSALKLSELFIKELPNVESLMKDFSKQKEAFDKEKARVEKSIKNEEKRSQALQEMVEPRLELPSRFIPNTAEHVKKFAPIGTKYDPGALQAPPITATIADDLNVPNEVLLLLYLGIGIYSPESKVLNPIKMDGVDTRYTEKVVEMCSNGYISFLFADRSIVYGTNFPFSNVFIDPEFAKDSSLNTLYQLIGRAGRVGKSYMAKVVLIGEELKNRFVNFNEENIEANHLEKAMDRVCNEFGVSLYSDSQMEELSKKAKGEAKEEIKEVEKKMTTVAISKPKEKRAKTADELWEEEQAAAAAEAPVAEEDLGNWDDDGGDGEDLGNWDD